MQALLSSAMSRTLLLLLGLAAVLYAATGVPDARAQSADLALVSDDNTKVTFVRNFTTGAFINDANDTVNAGDEVQFLIKVHNQGPDAVAATPSSPIIIQAPHPANFTLKTASNNGDPGVVYDAANKQFRIERTVAFNEVVQFQYRFYASAVSTGTNFTAQISSAPVPDSRSDNDSFSRSVNIVGPSADLTFNSPISGSKTFLRNLTAPGQPFLTDGASVNLGDELSLFIKIHNLGPEIAAASAAFPLVIAPTIPAGFTIEQGLVFGQPNFFYDAATNQFRIERDIAVDEKVQVEVRIRATSVVANTTVSTVFAALPVSDPDLSDASNTFQRTVNTVGPIADLTFTSPNNGSKTFLRNLTAAGQPFLFDGNSVNLGDEVTLFMKVHNLGPEVATASAEFPLVVAPTVPAGFTIEQGLVFGQPNFFYDAATNQFRIERDIAVDEVVQFELRMRATSAVSNTTVSAEFASLPVSDPDLSDASNRFQRTVNTVAQPGDIEIISVIPDQSTVLAGQEVLFTIAGKNHGNLELTTVYTDLTVPPGLTFVQFEPGGNGTIVDQPANGLRWKINTWPAGVNRSITARFRAEESPLGEQTLIATYNGANAGGQADPNGTNNSASAAVTTSASADLSVSLSSNTTQIPTEGQVSVTLIADNLSSIEAASNAVFDVTIPPTFTNPTTGLGVGTFGNGQWSVPSIAAGGRATLQITLTAGSTPAADQIFDITRNASTPADPNAANDFASRSISIVERQADLAIGLEIVEPLTFAGSLEQDQEFTVLLTAVLVSQTSMPASARVNLPLPPGVSLPFGQDASPNYDPATNIWSLENFQLGAIDDGGGGAVYTFVASQRIRLKSDQSGLLDLVASLADATDVEGKSLSDPDPSNDQAAVSITLTAPPTLIADINVNTPAVSLPPGVEASSLVRASNGTPVLDGQQVFVGEHLVLRRTITSSGPDDPGVGQDGLNDDSLTVVALFGDDVLFPHYPTGAFPPPDAFLTVQSDPEFFRTDNFNGGVSSAAITIKPTTAVTSHSISVWALGNSRGLYGQAVDPDVSAGSNRFSVTLNAQRSLGDLAVSWDNPSVSLAQGEWVEPVLTVTNLGTEPMFGINLDLSLDQNVLLHDLEISSGSVQGTELGGFSLGALPSSTRWQINALEAGQSATMRLSIFGRSNSGAASFSAAASSADSDDNDPANDSASLNLTFGPASGSTQRLFDRKIGEIPPVSYGYVKAIPDNIDGSGNPSPFFAPESIVFLSPLNPQLQLVSDEISDIAIAYNSVRHEFLEVLEIRFKAKDPATSTADAPDVYELYAARIDAFTGQPLDRDADGFADLTRLTWTLDDSLNLSARHPAIAYNPQDDTYLLAWTEIAAVEGDTLDPMVPKTARYRELAGDATYDPANRSGAAFQVAAGANPQGLDTTAYSSTFRPSVAYLSAFNDFAFALAGRPTAGDPIALPVDEVFAGRFGVNGGVASLISDHQYGVVLAGGAGAEDQRVGRVTIVPGAGDAELGLAWDIGEPVPGQFDYDGSETLHSRVHFSKADAASLLPLAGGADGRGHLAIIDEEPDETSIILTKRPKEGSFPNAFIAPVGEVSTRTAFEPDLAYDSAGDRYLLVWAGRRAGKNFAPDNGQTEIYGRILSTSGVFTTPIRRISRPYEGDIVYTPGPGAASPLHNADNPHVVFYPGPGTFLVSYDVCGHFEIESIPGGRHCTPGVNIDQIDAASGLHTDINKDGLFDRGYALRVLGNFPIEDGQGVIDGFDRGNDLAVVDDGLIGLAMRRPLARGKSYGEWHQAGFRRLNVTTDVAVQLDASTFQPEPGAVFDLTVTLTNTTTNTQANNIVINVPLPGDQQGAGLVFESGSGSAGWSYDVASGQLRLDQLPAGSSESYIITVRNSFSDQEIAVNAALLRLAEFDSNAANNTAAINLLVPAGADLALELGDQQIFLTETEAVTMTLRANSGSIANAVVSIVPPGPGFRFMPGEFAPSVGTFDEPSLTWSLPPAVSSEEATLAFMVEGLEAGDHDLTASVVGELPDPFPANSSVTANMAVLSTHPITVDSGELFGLFPQPVPSNGLARTQVTAQDALSRPINYNWVVDCPNLSDELVPFDGSFEFSDPTSAQWDWRAPYNLSGTDQICSVRVEMNVEGNARSLWWPDEQNGSAFTVLEHPGPFTNYGLTALAESLVEAGSDRVLGGVGEQAQYEFNIVNLSQTPGSNLQIDVVLPDGVDYAAHTLVGNGAFTPGGTPGEAGVWQLTSLNPSAVATLTVTVDINTNNFGNPDPEGSDLQTATATLVSATPADPDGAMPASATLERYLVNRVSILQEPSLFIDWDTIPIAVQALVSQGQGRFLGLEASNSLGRPMTFQWTQSCTDGVSLGSFDDASAVEPIWTAPLFVPDEFPAVLSCVLDVTVGAGVTANDVSLSYSIRVAEQPDVDLALSLEVLDKAVLLGGRARLRLTVSNNGPGLVNLESIGSLTARLSLPDELQLDLESAVPVDAFVTQAGEWFPTGTLNEGASTTLEIDAVATSDPVGLGNYLLAGQLETALVEPDYGNNFSGPIRISIIDQDRINIEDLLAVPDSALFQGNYAVTLTASSLLGAPLTYLWDDSACALGDSGRFTTAGGVEDNTLEDPIWISPQYNVADFGPALCTLQVTIDDGAGGADPVIGSLPVTVLHPSTTGSDISIDLRVSDTAVQVGSFFDLIVTARNNGPDAISADNVQVSVSLPAGALADSITFDGLGGDSFDPVAAVWTIDNLDRDQSRVLSVKVRMIAEDILSFTTASLGTSSQADPNPNNDSDVKSVEGFGLVSIFFNSLPSVLPNPVRPRQNANATVMASLEGSFISYEWFAFCPAPLGGNGAFADGTPEDGLGNNSRDVTWTAPANTTAIQQDCAFYSLATATNLGSASRRTDVGVIAEPEADLSLLVTRTPAAVFSGEDVTVTLEVRNGGPANVNQTQVDIDVLPADGLSFVSVEGATLNQDFSYNSNIGLGRWLPGALDFDPLDPLVGRRTITMTFRGDVGGSAGQARTVTIDSTVSDGMASDPLGGNNNGVVSVDVLAENKASFTQTASALPDPVESEGTTQLSATAIDAFGFPVASYSWSASCNGNLAGNGFFVDGNNTAQLPLWTAPRNDTGAQQFCDLTVLATPTAGQAESSTVRVEVDSIPTLNLSLSKTVNASPVVVLSRPEFTIVVTNNSPTEIAKDVVVQDSFHAAGFDDRQIEAISQGVFDTAGGAWQVGDIPAGGNATLVVSLRATAAGVYSGSGNLASISAAEVIDNNGADDSDGADITIEETQTLAFTLIADPISIVSGGMTTLTVEATTTNFTDPIPFTMTEVCAGSPVAGSFDPVIGEIAPGGNPRVITVDWTAPENHTGVNQGCSLTITGSVAGSAESSATANVTVETLPVADIEVSLVGAPNGVVLGESFQLQAVAENLGIIGSDGVVARVLLPTGFAAAPGNWAVDHASRSFDPATGLWQINALGNGDVATLDLTIDVEAVDPIANPERLGAKALQVRRVASDVPDPNSANDIFASILEVIDDNTLELVRRPVASPASVIGMTDVALLNFEVRDRLERPITYLWNAECAVELGGHGSFDDVSLREPIWSSAENTDPTIDYDCLLSVEASVQGAQLPISVDLVVPVLNPNTIGIDLSTAVATDRQAYEFGDTVLVTVPVSNNSLLDNASGVAVSFDLPPGLQFLDSDDPANLSAQGNGVYNWSVGNVFASSTKTLTVTALAIGEGTQDISLIVAAADQADPVPDNDVSLATVSVVPENIITIDSIFASSNSLIGGGTISVSVVAHDLLGGNPLNYQWAVESCLPSGGSGAFLAPTLATANWTSPNIGPAADGALKQTCTLTVDIDDGDDPAERAQAQGRLTIEILPSDALGSELVVLKQSDKQVVLPGESLRFSVRVTNEGPAKATNLAVTDVLNPGFVQTAALAEQGSYNGGIWTVGDLEVGASAELFVDVIARAESAPGVGDGANGQLPNTAFVSAVDQADPNPGNETAQVVVSVIPENLLDIAGPFASPNSHVGEGVSRLMLTVEDAVSNSNTSYAWQAICPSLPGSGSFSDATAGEPSWESPFNGTAETVVCSLRVDVTVTDALFGQIVSTRTVPVTLLPAGAVGADIDLRVTSLDTALFVGEVSSAIVRLENNGPEAATDVTISLALSDELAVTGAPTLSGGTYDSGDWSVAGLGVGEVLTLELPIAASGAGAVPGTGSITASVTQVTPADPNTGPGSNDPTSLLFDILGDNQIVIDNPIAANPAVLIGGETSQLSIVAHDVDGLGVSYRWTAACPGFAGNGSFAPSSTAAEVVWTSPANTTGAQDICTLMVDLDAPGSNGISGTAETMADITVNPTVDTNVAVTAQVTPSAIVVAPGLGTAEDRGLLNFEVMNQGVIDATGVQVDIPIPAGLTLIAPVPGNYTAGTGEWAVGTLLPGESQVLQLTVEGSAVAPGNSTTINIEATFRTDLLGENDTNALDDLAAVALTVANRNEVTLDGILANPASLAGDGINSTTVSVEVTTTLGDPATYTWSAACPAEFGGNHGAFDVTDQAVVDWMPPDNQTGQVVICSLTADATSSDGSTLPSLATVDIPVLPNGTDPDDVFLVLQGIPNFTTLIDGETLTIDFSLTNFGPSDANGAEITLQLPGTGFMVTGTSDDPNFDGTTWSVPAPIPGDGSTVNFTINAVVDALGGTVQTPRLVSIEAAAAAIENDPLLDDNSVTTSLSIVDENVIQITAGPNADPDTILGAVGSTPQDRTLNLSVTAIDEIGRPLTHAWTLLGCTGGIDSGILATPGEATTDWEGPVNTTGTPQSCDFQITVSAEGSQPVTGLVTATVLHDGAAGADISLKANTPSKASTFIGDQITYTVTIRNNGPVAATDVTVTDLLPGKLGFVSDDAGGAYDDGTGTWAVGALAFGEEKSLLITADVLFPGSVVNTASVTSVVAADGNGDQNPNNDSRTSIIEVGAQNRIHVSDLTATPTSLIVGMATAGEQRLVQLDLTAFDDLGAGLSYAWTASCADGNAADNGSFSSTSIQDPIWTAPENISGAGANALCTLTVNLSADGASALQESIQIVVLPEGLADPDISLAMTVDRDLLAKGEIATFTLSASNNGGADASNVAIRDVLPAGLLLQTGTLPPEFDTTTDTWTIPLLSVGQTVSIQLQAQAVREGFFVNLAELAGLDAPGVDVNPLNDSAFRTVTVIPGNAIEVLQDIVANPDSLVGQGLFALSVEAEGLLGRGVTATWSSSDCGGLGVGAFDPAVGQQTNWTSPTNNLAGANAGCTLTVDLTADSAEPLQLTKQVTLLPTDITTPDISLRLEVDRHMALLGDTALFTLTLTNNSIIDATGVSVQLEPLGDLSADPRATGFTFLQLIGAGSFDADSSELLVPAIAAGETAVARFLVSLDELGLLENEASLNGTVEGDANSGNDVSRTQVTSLAANTITSTIPATIVPQSRVLQGDFRVISHAEDALELGIDYLWSADCPAQPDLGGHSFADLLSRSTIWASGINNTAQLQTCNMSVDMSAPFATDVTAGLQAHLLPDPAAGDETDVAIQASVDVANPLPGSLVTFTITAELLGAIAPDEALVVVALPNGFEIESATGDGVFDLGLWTISELTSVATLQVAARVMTSTEQVFIADLVFLSAGMPPILLFDLVSANNISFVTVTPRFDPGITFGDPAITATPNPVLSAEISNLSLDVTSDPTGLTYYWTSDCGGSFSDVSASNPQWTAPVNATSGLVSCTLNAAVSSATGGTVRDIEIDVLPENQNSDLTVTQVIGKNPLLDQESDTTVTLTVSNSVGGNFVGGIEITPDFGGLFQLDGAATGDGSWTGAVWQLTPGLAPGESANLVLPVTAAGGLVFTGDPAAVTGDVSASVTARGGAETGAGDESPSESVTIYEENRLTATVLPDALAVDSGGTTGFNVDVTDLVGNGITDYAWTATCAQAEDGFPGARPQDLRDSDGTPATGTGATFTWTAPVNSYDLPGGTPADANSDCRIEVAVTSSDGATGTAAMGIMVYGEDIDRDNLLPDQKPGTAIFPAAFAVDIAPGSPPMTGFFNIGHRPNTAMTGCRVELATPFNGTFFAQPFSWWDAGRNLLQPNEPMDLPSGVSGQTWFFSMQPNETFPPTRMDLQVVCDNGESQVLSEFNTLLLTSEAAPGPRAVATILFSPIGNRAQVPLNTGNTNGFGAIRNVNVGGVVDLVIESVLDDPRPTLPVAIDTCIIPIGATNCAVDRDVNRQTVDLTDDPATPEDESLRSFRVRLRGQGQSIPLNILQNRLYMRLERPDGAIVGASSFAVCTTDNANC
ncbi:DUF7507 domain-containing protein [Limibacillus halophilus]|uniref:Putative repeat protein (TIGR01451 family) n=1 Tax=Limibacillus halophilus TaxID=1579333 RepID=A0A839SV94_9PROT|nr:DUF11 domain-containing protein [Limibacillus halophilus]MBB3064905.1 putative repeat protein (TIGR01451 family) [Limibacillus halophilus]